MTTFTDFQNSRKKVDDILVATGLDPDSDYGPEGYLYLDSCYVEITEKGFCVPIGSVERLFDDLEAAEKYLWEEWASVECVGA